MDRAPAQRCRYFESNGAMCYLTPAGSRNPGTSSPHTSPHNVSQIAASDYHVGICIDGEPSSVRVAMPFYTLWRGGEAGGGVRGIERESERERERVAKSDIDIALSSGSRLQVSTRSTATVVPPARKVDTPASPGTGATA